MSTMNPFPGLRPFSATESHLFFGRKRHIDEIIRKVNEFKFVSIVGTSGSGKSSLVRAGLLPALEKEDEGWIICKLRPGEDPIKSLAVALMSIPQLSETLPQDEGELIEILGKSKRGLVQALRSVISAGNKLLILVDQFEELFRFNPASNLEDAFDVDQHFVDLLLNCVGEADLPVYVILTLRSDFLGDCERFMGLPEAINDGQFLIPRMNSDELKECIVGPVSITDGKVAPRLVQHLIEEVGSDPDQLPVLQHTLMRTWEIWHDEGRTVPIDVDHYDRTGGMTSALSNHAEEAYSELQTKQERRICEILFKTITMKGSDNRGIRRPTSIKNISLISGEPVEDIIRVVNVFRKKGRGFIMPPGDVKLHENSIIDISHESLMRVWDRLKQWVDEEAESAELYYHITNNAILYEQDRASLWRDPDLQIALDWRAHAHHNKHWSKQYNEHYDLAQTFIDLSYNDKQYHLAEQKRRQKFQQIALAIFLILLSGLSLWAFSERNKSVENAKVAIAQKKESEKQRGIAEQQKVLAEKNLTRAQEQEQKAIDQQRETERQKELALQKAEEARIARMRSEQATKTAVSAREMAIQDRLRAENQKKISDSLRLEAELAEAKTQRLQMLSLSQTIAIKSKLAEDYTFDESVKILLALKAYEMNKNFEGDPTDPEIFAGLFSAYRLTQKDDEFMHRSHTDLPKSISFNKGTNEYVSVGNDGRIIKTGIENGKLRTERSSQVSLFLDNVTVSPDGGKVVISCDNNSLQFYDLSNMQKQYASIEKVHKDEIMDIVWSNDFVITASLDTTIRVFKDAGGELLRSYKMKGRPLTMAFSSAKQMLLVGSDDGNVYQLNPYSAEAPSLVAQIGMGQIKGICFNPGANLFAIGTSEGFSGVYALKDPSTPISVLSGHKAGITGVTFHPKNNFVATSCLDKVVRVWNVNEPNPHPIEFKEHTNWVMDVAFDQSGENLASAGKDKTIRVYPLDPAIIVERLKKHIARDLTEEEWNLYVSEEIPYWSVSN